MIIISSNIIPLFPFCLGLLSNFWDIVRIPGGKTRNKEYVKSTFSIQLEKNDEYNDDTAYDIYY